MEQVVNTLIAKVNKKHGVDTLIKGSDIRTEVIPRTHTGSVTLDVALGGGWPANQWSEIVGHESHGKTAVALKTVAENQKRNPKWTCLWVAAEEFVLDYAEMLGVDRERMVILNTNVMETAYQTIIEAAETRAVDCIVVDSLPALLPEGEFEAAMDDWQVGLGARVTNKFFRKQGTASKRSLTAEDRPITGLIINQWREKIGIVYGDPRTTPGGRMKNFTFFSRIEVRRGDWIKDDKRTVGIEINMRVFKNKSAAPERTAVVDFYFDDFGGFRAGQFDRMKEIVNLALFYDIIVRGGGGNYSYGGEKWRGRPALLEQLRQDLDLQDAIEHEVMAIASKKVPTIVDDRPKRPSGKKVVKRRRA